MRGERRLAVVDVEEVRERAREDALDARDLIASLAQVAQRLDDRQARADRGLIEIVRAGRAPRARAALR